MIYPFIIKNICLCVSALYKN